MVICGTIIVIIINIYYLIVKYVYNMQSLCAIYLIVNMCLIIIYNI